MYWGFQGTADGFSQQAKVWDGAAFQRLQGKQAGGQSLTQTSLFASLPGGRAMLEAKYMIASENIMKGDLQTFLGREIYTSC